MQKSPGVNGRKCGGFWILSSPLQTLEAVLTKKKSSNPPLAQEGGWLETVPEGLVPCIFEWQIPGQRGTWTSTLSLSKKRRERYESWENAAGPFSRDYLKVLCWLKTIFFSFGGLLGVLLLLLIMHKVNTVFCQCQKWVDLQKLWNLPKLKVAHITRGRDSWAWVDVLG